MYVHILAYDRLGYDCAIWLIVLYHGVCKVRVSVVKGCPDASEDEAT